MTPEKHADQGKLKAPISVQDSTTLKLNKETSSLFRNEDKEEKSVFTEFIKVIPGSTFEMTAKKKGN